MKSRVYFIGVSNSDDAQTIKLKLARLLEESRLLDFIHRDDKIAVKMHFGEEGNTGFVKPEYARIICEAAVKKQARPFLTDTNTLYRGRRMNAKDHLLLAYEHGFTKDKAGVEVIIPEDTRKEEAAGVKIDRKLIKIAKVASLFLKSDAIIGVSHFKGHLMTGFGGALKNIGMGCATIEGKLAQHSDISPVINRKICQACGACVEICPSKAIFIRDKKGLIDSSLCIGCASCIAICTRGAIDVNWEAGGERLQDKMIEYAFAILKQKVNKAVFVNFAIKITKECDCLAKDDPRIVPDVGIFASKDPVSIDKACFDSIIKAAGKDIFKEAHPKRDGSKQLHYASSLGLGSLDYDLIDIAGQ